MKNVLLHVKLSLGWWKCWRNFLYVYVNGFVASTSGITVPFLVNQILKSGDFYMNLATSLLIGDKALFLAIVKASFAQESFLVGFLKNPMTQKYWTWRKLYKWMLLLVYSWSSKCMSSRCSKNAYFLWRYYLTFQSLLNSVFASYRGCLTLKNNGSTKSPSPRQ